MSCFQRSKLSNEHIFQLNISLWWRNAVNISWAPENKTWQTTSHIVSVCLWNRKWSSVLYCCILLCIHRVLLQFQGFMEAAYRTQLIDMCGERRSIKFTTWGQEDKTNNTLPLNRTFTFKLLVRRTSLPLTVLQQRASTRQALITEINMIMAHQRWWEYNIIVRLSRT